jgi:hypothetical protein
MADVSIRVGLDAGGLVSGAAMARDALRDLDSDIKKAQKDGDHAKAGELIYLRERNKTTASGFERDIQNVSGNPAFQRLTDKQSAGQTLSQSERQTMEQYGKLTDAIGKYTEQFAGAAAKGDIKTMMELTPQMESAHKYVNTVLEGGAVPDQFYENYKNKSGLVGKPGNGDGPGYATEQPEKRSETAGQAGNAASTIVGGLVSGAAMARDALRDLDSDIKKAQKDGDHAKAGELIYLRERNKTTASGFERDIQNVSANPAFQQLADKQSAGQTLSQSERQTMEQYRNLTDAVKKLTEQFSEAAAKGDIEAMAQLAPQMESAQKNINTVFESGAVPEALKKFLGNGVNELSAAMISNAALQGVQTYINFQNKSSLINKLGSGDGMGYAIEQKQREREIAGQAGNAAGTVVGSGISAAIAVANPGIAALLAPTINSVSGSIGKLTAGFPAGVEIARLSNIDAKSKAWEQFAPGAADINKLINPDAGNSAVNHENIMGVFDGITGAMAGTSAAIDDSMEAMRRIIKEGMAADPYETTASVLRFKEGTGADLDTLTGYAAKFERYGKDSGALGTAYQGLQASGLQKGQYQEFLQSMQKIFEDGIAKGIVKGSQEIAGDMAYLADLSGNSPPVAGGAGRKPAYGHE